MSTVSPTQSNSLALAVMHSLILLWRPPPQDLLHSVNGDHSDQELGGGDVMSGSSPVLLPLRLSGDSSEK